MKFYIEKFFPKIVMDLGTSNLRLKKVFDEELLNEPSIVAVNNVTGKAVSVGQKARDMLGRTPEHITTRQPYKKGVVCDFDATHILVGSFLDSYLKANFLSKRIFGPKVLVGVPTIITEVEINALVDATKTAGASFVYVVENPIALAIGSGINVDEAKGKMYVDIGGGTTEINVLSMGSIISSNTSLVSGSTLNEAIVSYVRQKYNLSMGIKLAEEIKIRYASLEFGKKDEKIEIKGRDLVLGLPKIITLSSREISEAIQKPIDEISKAIIDTIEKLPPEIISDLLESGVTLVGGTSKIKGLDKYFSKLLKIKFNVTTEPTFTLIQGLENIMSDKGLLRRYSIKDLILK